jgi:hypothetical protein
MIRDDEDWAGTRYFFQVRSVDEVKTDTEGIEGVLQKLMGCAALWPPIIYLCETIESECLLDNGRYDSWLKG